MIDTALLEVRDLTVSLRFASGVIALVEDVSFSIEPGKVLALVGESGSGKSVTAQALMQLLPRSMAIHRGSIRFRSERQDGVIDVARLPADGAVMRRIRGNEIAMIFQEPMSSFSPVHTIGDHLMEVLRAHTDMSKAARRKRAIDLLERVQIPDAERALDRYPHEFSGGMRQRAMIARALACRPSLLIADEPTTALDVTIQAQILELLKELRSELGMAVLFITHDLGVVAQTADEVAVMYTGKLLEQGPTRQLFRSPRHPYTTELLAATPQLRARASDGELRTIRGSVPSLFDMPAGCTFHPRCEAFIEGTCERAFPDATAVGPDHWVRCFQYG